MRHATPVIRAAARSEREIDAIARAGDVVNGALHRAREAARPGATTADVDAAVEAVIFECGAEPLFKGYRQGSAPPFPGCACVSVNEEVVHGVPSAERALRTGDMVSIDVGVRFDGWCADSATTLVVGGGDAGDIDAEGRPVSGGSDTLIGSTRRVLLAAIGAMRPGVMWSAVASEMERLTLASGFGYVAEYVGHGIGRELHEPPKAPSYRTGYQGPDFELQEGVVLAIEPLLATGEADEYGRVAIRVADDGWTVKLADTGVACHEECIAAVTGGGARIISGIAHEFG